MKNLYFCKNFNHEKISDHNYFDDHVDFWFRARLVRHWCLLGQTIVDINNSLKEYATANAIVYVDYHSALADEQLGLPKSMSDDGCHPNADTYFIMEDLVLKAIQKAILK